MYRHNAQNSGGKPSFPSNSEKIIYEMITWSHLEEQNLNLELKKAESGKAFTHSYNDDINAGLAGLTPGSSPDNKSIIIL